MTESLAPPTGRDGAAAAARWLTALVTVLVAAASAAGLWVAGVYQDAEAVTAMFRGYDLVTLVIVAPLLAVTLLPGVQDRGAAQLLRLSGLAYCVYDYGYYVFGAALNAVLLVHVAIFALSLYALVLSLVATDVVGLAGRFRARTPVKTVAAVLLVLGVALAALQVSGLVGFALTGAVPDEPSRLVVPPTFTRLGAVLDLALLVPVYLLGAVWLWRRRAWGYVLATTVLVAGALHQLSYVAGMLFQAAADVPGATFDPFEPVIVLLYVAGSALLLGNLRSAASNRTKAAAARELVEPRS